MIDLGYMAKRIASRPKWLEVPDVYDIYAVSDCISDDFCDYVNYWKHNGFWFFNSPVRIRDIATENQIDLTDTVLVYYRGHTTQFDADLDAWTDYGPDIDFATNVTEPCDKRSWASISLPIRRRTCQNVLRSLAIMLRPTWMSTNTA